MYRALKSLSHLSEANSFRNNLEMSLIIGLHFNNFLKLSMKCDLVETGGSAAMHTSHAENGF